MVVYIRFGKIQQHRYRSVSDALPGTRAEENREAEQPISDSLHEAEKTNVISVGDSILDYMLG